MLKTCLLAWLPAAAASVLSYPALQAAQVTRASDFKNLQLTSLWQEDDRAVVVFLRHFG